MGNWSADTGVIRTSGDSLKDLASGLSEIASQIRTKGNLQSLNFSGKYQMQLSLTELANSVDTQSSGLANLKEALITIAGLYENTEKEISGQGALKSGWSDTSAESDLAWTESTGAFGEGDGGGGIRGEEEDDTEEELWKKLLKNWLTIQNKFYKNKEAGLVSTWMDYLDDFTDFFSGQKSGLSGTVDFCDLAKSSSKLWKSLYSVLSGKDSSGILKTQFGPAAAWVTIAAGVSGMLGSIVEIFDTDYESGWGALSDAFGAVSDGSDILKGIYDLKNVTNLAKGSEGLLSTSSQWLTLGKTVLTSLSQLSESIGEYSADGSWSLEDTGECGVDVAIAGLEELVSGVTFGLISAESFGTTTEDISQGMKDWAANVGTWIGNKILELRKK